MKTFIHSFIHWCLVTAFLTNVNMISDFWFQISEQVQVQVHILVHNVKTSPLVMAFVSWFLLSFFFFLFFFCLFSWQYKYEIAQVFLCNLVGFFLLSLCICVCVCVKPMESCSIKFCKTNIQRHLNGSRFRRCCR